MSFHLQFVSEFKNISDENKPREKLAKFGPESLNLWELLALIFRTGERHAGGHFEDVQELSKRVLAEAGFRGIFLQKSVEEVQENFLLQKHHAELVVAVSEICRRLQGRYDTFDASEPSKIFEKFQSLQKAKQEQCHVLHLGENKKCVFQELVAMGQGNSVEVRPTDILRSAIWLGASEIVVVHNHAGKPDPSPEDISWTLMLSQGAWNLHQIKLADHIIIGQNGYFSFAEKDLL